MTDSNAKKVKELDLEIVAADRELLKLDPAGSEYGYLIAWRASLVAHLDELDS